MKKICQTLWEKGSFKTWLIFSCLRDKVHIFYPLLLQFAHSVCIVVRISPLETEEGLSNILGKGPL